MQCLLTVTPLPFVIRSCFLYISAHTGHGKIGKTPFKGTVTSPKKLNLFRAFCSQNGSSNYRTEVCYDLSEFTSHPAIFCGRLAIGKSNNCIRYACQLGMGGLAGSGLRSG